MNWTERFVDNFENDPMADFARQRGPCSICSDPKVPVAGLTVCVRCDWPLEWPLWEHWAWLIWKAHELGVSKLERG